MKCSFGSDRCRRLLCLQYLRHNLLLFDKESPHNTKQFNQLVWKKSKAIIDCIPASDTFRTSRATVGSGHCLMAFRKRRQLSRSGISQLKTKDKLKTFKSML